MTSRDTLVTDVLHGHDKGFGASALRALLTPLSWLHLAGLETYLLPYRTGIRKRYRLGIPVIAIGNLTSGGTGKTPMAALVAGQLRDSGRRVVLLSRGHRGKGESGNAPRVVSDGETILLGADESGDEPNLLARLLPGVPVIVGKDRRKSGRLAVEKFAPDILVLDDGLQFWQLHRDLDIVLLDARRPFDNGHVLPRGLLREPPFHLARAGIVVLTRADRATPEQITSARSAIAKYAPKVAVFTARHAPLGYVSGETLLPTDALAGKSVLAFSGIADGTAFVQTLETLGVTVARQQAFGDHHTYTPEEITALAGQNLTTVTTEKDLVKVASLWPANSSPLYALRVGMAIESEVLFFTALQTVYHS